MKKLCIQLLAACALTFSGQSFAAESCVPAFLKEGNKYYFQNGKNELKVKVVKIDAASCWVKVKEVLNESKKNMNYSDKQKNPFWVNLSEVFAIRNK